MILDTSTLLFVAFFLAAFMSAALFLTWRINRPMKALKYWSLGYLGISVGLLLSMLRGVYPSPAIVVASNFLICLAYLAIWAGIRRLHGRSWSLLWPSALTVLLMVFLTWFTYVDDRLMWRLTGASVYLAVMSFLCGVNLLRARRGQVYPMAKVTGIVFLGHGIFYWLRAILSVYEAPLPGLLAPSVVQSATYLLASVVITMNGIGFIMIAAEQLQQELRRAATHDGLTGVLNREALLAIGKREFSRWQRSGRPFALVLMDLDHFKAINDHYGHQGGDEVLRVFAATAARQLRDADLLGRYGGEEFFALLPDTSAAEAGIVADRLREAVERTPVVHDDEVITFTVSMGVAEPRRHAAALDAVVAEADVALYRAKNLGRNRIEVAAGDHGLLRDMLATAG